MDKDKNFYALNYVDPLLAWRGFIILNDPNQTYLKNGMMIEILWPSGEKSVHKVMFEEEFKTVVTMTSDRISQCYNIYIEIEHHGIKQKTPINTLKGIKIRLVEYPQGY